MSASILAAVEMAPRDPILGVTEAFVADQTRRRSTSASASTATTTARCRCSSACAAPSGNRSKRRRRAATCRSTACQSYDRAVQELVFGAEPAGEERAHRHRPGAGRNRRPEDRRRFPAAPRLRRPRCGSASRAGRTTAPCSRTPASRSTPIPITIPRPAAWISPACWARSSACPRARSWCCTRAATTRPAWICRASNGSRCSTS